MNEEPKLEEKIDELIFKYLQKYPPMIAVIDFLKDRTFVWELFKLHHENGE